MAVTEETRHRMHVKFEEVLGPDVAITVMEHLPPVGWADVCTKRDLDAQTILLRAEFTVQTSELRTEFAAQTADLRAEFAAQTADLRAEFAAQTADLNAQTAALRAELEKRFQRLLLQLLGSLTALFTLMLTLALLLVGHA